MSLEDERDRGRRRPADPERGAEISQDKQPKKRADNPELGSALRTVYQRTIDEDIPPEMLDLLGKLG